MTADAARQEISKGIHISDFELTSERHVREGHGPERTTTLLLATATGDANLAKRDHLLGTQMRRIGTDGPVEPGEIRGIAVRCRRPVPFSRNARRPVGVHFRARLLTARSAEHT